MYEPGTRRSWEGDWEVVEGNPGIRWWLVRGFVVPGKGQEVTEGGIRFLLDFSRFNGVLGVTEGGGER